MKHKTLIELSEKDLKDVLCEHFGIERNTAEVRIYHTEADRPWESRETSIKIEGFKK